MILVFWLIILTGIIQCMLLLHMVHPSFRMVHLWLLLCTSIRLVFGAPPDPYASYRAPVQFQNSSQAFFAAPVQHQLGQHSFAAVRPGTSDGSGGSGGSGGGYQGSSSPSQQQFSRSGKQLLLTDGQGPWY
jgi:uncharacterized membrane protein YgcG